MRYSLTLLLLLGFAGWADACNVPVFRYALERWRPDAYRATLFHRGPLSAAEQAMAEGLGQGEKQSPTNLSVRLLDVDQLDNDADRALYAAQKSPSLPWLVVQYPQASRMEQPIWTGALTAEAVPRLAISPLRMELVRRLAAGQTAVWLMLECGDPTKDDQVAEQLETELGKLAMTLKLPELTASPDDSLLSDAPLKVEFSLLRVPRSTKAEQPLVELLLHAEPDLKDFAEPMVFPVFGRGRALLPLIGAGITTDNILESASFLVGACSCEIKELNPGFDLLLAADWQALLFNGATPPKSEVVQPVATTGEPVLVAIPPGTPAAPGPTVNQPNSSTLGFYYVAVGPKWIIPGAKWIISGAAVLLLVGLIAVRYFR